MLLGGIGEFVAVTIVCAISAGLGTWLFGSNAHHIGASGVVFGYVGYLLVRPFYDHRIWSAIMTLIVGTLYGTALLWSLIPQGGISWSGHFFGFVGGCLAARATARSAAPEPVGG